MICAFSHGCSSVVVCMICVLSVMDVAVLLCA
jgi:hypothetical protein